MKFSDAELSTISNGLTIARDRFIENAALLRTPEMSHPSNRGLAEQFDRQAEQTTAIINRIAEEEGL